jgi:hypothetical protein
MSQTKKNPYFVDYDFPPEKGMLAPMKKLFRSVWDKIEWKYADEYINSQATITRAPEVENFKSVNISQTISPLSYFHDALKLLCLNPRHMAQLLQIKSVSKNDG